MGHQVYEGENDSELSKESLDVQSLDIRLDQDEKNAEIYKDESIQAREIHMHVLYCIS